MKRKIDKILEECQRRIDEMRRPLTELDMLEIIEDIEEDDRLTDLEEQNRYHCVTDWDYDLDPNEL